MPSTQETQLRIRQTLDVDPEITFINWELNIQDVAAATARSVHARGLLSLDLNPTQWNTHVSNASINDQGQNVIAQRYSSPESNGNYRIQNEEQNSGRLDDRRTELKTGHHRQHGRNNQAHHCPPPLSFQDMSISNIIEEVRTIYGKITRHTVKRIKEILAEKLDNVRNLRTHVAKMRNAFSIKMRNAFS
jgi:hypothetical protein